jgi:hypothetical protein
MGRPDFLRLVLYWISIDVRSLQGRAVAINAVYSVSFYRPVIVASVLGSPHHESYMDTYIEHHRPCSSVCRCIRYPHDHSAAASHATPRNSDLVKDDVPMPVLSRTVFL